MKNTILAFVLLAASTAFADDNTSVYAPSILTCRLLQKVEAPLTITLYSQDPELTQSTSNGIVAMTAKSPHTRKTIHLASTVQITVAEPTATILFADGHQQLSFPITDYAASMSKRGKVFHANWSIGQTSFRYSCLPSFMMPQSN